MNVACSGFVHALALADMSIRCGAAQRALVIGAEKLTAFTDMADRSTCVLTADGAGAFVLDASADPGVGPVAWGSAPDLTQAVRILPPSNVFAQDGRAVYRWALTTGPPTPGGPSNWPSSTSPTSTCSSPTRPTCGSSSHSPSSSGMTNRVVVTDVAESGNTSAASIPLGFSKWWHDGRIPPSARALLFGFGGGFAFASTVVRTPATR